MILKNPVDRIRGRANARLEHGISLFLIQNPQSGFLGKLGFFSQGIFLPFLSLRQLFEVIRMDI